MSKSCPEGEATWRPDGSLWPEHPEWQRRQKKHFRSPEEKERRRQKNRERAVVKDCLQGALAQLGGEQFFIELGQAGGEDRRCLANILSRLIPSEVVASVDNKLTIEIVEVNMTPDGRLIEGGTNGVPLLTAKSDAPTE